MIASDAFAEDNLSKGMEYYRQHKYKKAADCFDVIIRETNNEVNRLELPTPGNIDVDISNQAHFFFAQSLFELSKSKDYEHGKQDIEYGKFALKIACSHYYDEACTMLRNSSGPFAQALRVNGSKSKVYKSNITNTMWQRNEETYYFNANNVMISKKYSDKNDIVLFEGSWKWIKPNSTIMLILRNNSIRCDAEGILTSNSSMRIEMECGGRETVKDISFRSKFNGKMPNQIN
jgi:hypothetical protein